MAIWVPSVTNQVKESQTPDSSKSARGYSPISHAGDDNEDNWRQANDGNDLELSIVGDGTDLEPIDKELLLDNLQVEKRFFTFPFDDWHFVHLTLLTLQHVDFLFFVSVNSVVLRSLTLLLLVYRFPGPCQNNI